MRFVRTVLASPRTWISARSLRRRRSWRIGNRASDLRRNRFEPALGWMQLVRPIALVAGCMRERATQVDVAGVLEASRPRQLTEHRIEGINQAADHLRVGVDVAVAFATESGLQPGSRQEAEAPEKPAAVGHRVIVS